MPTCPLPSNPNPGSARSTRFARWADTVRMLAGIGVIGSSTVGCLAYLGLHLPAGSDAVAAAGLILVALLCKVRR